MKTVTMKFGAELLKIELPDQTDVLSMATAEPLANPADAIQTALNHPIGTPGLDQIIKSKLQIKPDARAVVVISDNTRPVPYSGEPGILWPVIQKLLEHGFTREQILILVANGTHRALSEQDLRNMLDKRIFEYGIAVKNHNCRDKGNLVYLGETTRGSKIYINRDYIESDLKILTGLVESHFMAGASGGRKSVCPGLIGEEGTYVFHGAPMLASPYACDLQMENNPCHEEALEIAKKAGADFIVNVTMDPHFKISGVFAGDLEKAHQLAVERLKEDSGIKIDREYDIVVTHAGFVGINHYQTAKAGVAAIPALKPGGRLILVANNTDIDPVGSPMYRTVLHLLKLIGVEKFKRLLLSADWSFIPDQWQVQMWAKLFSKIPFDNFIYYSPQLAHAEYQTLPGKDGNLYLPAAMRYQGSSVAVIEVIEKAVQQTIHELRAQGQEKINIAYLANGPYGILIKHF
jgi:nickel-dependent lactate racemase